MDERRSTWGRWRRRPGSGIAASVALIGALTVGFSSTGVAAVAAADWQDVIVTGPGGSNSAAAVVDHAGGRVIATLPLIDGVAARLPAGATLPAGWFAAPQRTLTTAAVTAADTTKPVSTVRQTLGLPTQGTEGAGVTVAVVDTGVADVSDLTGRVTDRVNLTNGPGGDQHGHGTFMAGLIAGSGAGSAGAYRGVAPAANVVDVKVAGEQGATDLITVMRGLQWVDDHRRQIQVVNLSLSSGSPMPYQMDPLTQALEALWRKGIVVVVPSGNTGPGTGTVTSPGIDPTLLTVGGLDEAGTASRADDGVAAWSGRGGRAQLSKPDLVAPGSHLVGLLAPGSEIDVAYPASHVGDHYMLGSGTSMSTAVTSGVVADVLSRRSTLQPDAVKGLLTSTAYSAAGLTEPAAAGAGGLDAAQALNAAKSYQSGSKRADTDAAALAADAQGWRALDQAVNADDTLAAAAAWKQLSPQSRAWASRAWADLDPTSRAWASRAWASRAWAGGSSEDWVSRAWASRAWASRAWAGQDWSSRAWAGQDWASRAWASDAWSSRAWAGQDWASRAWASDSWSSRAWSWLPASP
jgi:serine protease AprX